MDVIGVGGIDFDDHIAPFSSRGMTTWVCKSFFPQAIKKMIITQLKAIMFFFFIFATGASRWLW
ncbi:MAG: hypothetical protein AAFP96_07510 [Bacteroidota bacterium]